MKTIPVRIITNRAGEIVWVEVQGYDCGVPGLAVTPVREWDGFIRGAWTLTHIETGRSLGPILQKREAGRLMKRLASLADWTQDDLPDSLSRKELAAIRKVLRG